MKGESVIVEAQLSIIEVANSGVLGDRKKNREKTQKKGSNLVVPKTVHPQVRGPFVAPSSLLQLFALDKQPLRTWAKLKFGIQLKEDGPVSVDNDV